MLIQNINQKLITEAISHSEERIKYEYNRFNLPNDKRKSMIVIGTIGQLIFKKLLENRNINFEFEYQAGRYDNMDFKINNDIVEIKTSGYDYKGYKHLNLLYSQDQLNAGIKKDFKYCVQIFINGYDRTNRVLIPKNCSNGVIAGYIPFLDIKKYPSQRRFFGDDYKVPISKLKNIDEIVKPKKVEQQRLF